MKTSIPRLRRKNDKGGMAVEAAVVLPLLILFLAAPLFLGRVFWYYDVAQKAAQDGARFLSSVSRAEIQASTGGAQPGVAALAKSIADEEIKGIRPGLVGASITPQCDYAECNGLSIPQTVRVSVQIRVRDDILGPITNELFGADGFLLTAAVTMRYAGN